MLFIEDRSIFNLVYFKCVRTTRRTENIHYISEYLEGTIFLSDMLFYSPKQEKQYPMVISESKRYWKIFSELFYANTEEKEITIQEFGTTKGKMKNNLHQNLVLEKQKKRRVHGIKFIPRLWFYCTESDRWKESVSALWNCDSSIQRQAHFTGLLFISYQFTTKDSIQFSDRSFFVPLRP